LDLNKLRFLALSVHELDILLNNLFIVVKFILSHQVSNILDLGIVNVNIPIVSVRSLARSTLLSSLHDSVDIEVFDVLDLLEDAAVEFGV